MKLENNRYVVTFSEKGGEILSFTDKEYNLQYMWQGDEEHWSGKNPTLFPIVGNTYSGSYEIDGKTYSMKNHGLIRYATLRCEKDDNEEVVFALDSDEATKQQYPFDFHYEIAYTLQDNKLTIHYTIKNIGTCDMPFSFGLHPGFRCPLVEGEVFEDYQLHFSNPEQLQQLVFDPKKQQAPHYEVSNHQVQDIKLDYDWIKKYATIIYKDMKSPFVTLQGKHHGVKVSCKGYPLLAIWTAKKDAPFICIEPWMGHGDFHDPNVDFYHREGTIILAPAKSYTCSYTIEVF